MGDSGEVAAGFLPAAPGSSSTSESMISCRSFSIELTSELWLAQAEGPRVAGCAAWFPFTRLSDSAVRNAKMPQTLVFNSGELQVHKNAGALRPSPSRGQRSQVIWVLLCP